MSISPFLQRLLFVNQFGIDKGKINILGERQIMLSASSILGLQEIDETKIYDLGKKSGLRNMDGIVEHAKVYKRVKDVFISNLAKLGQKIGKTDEGMIRTLQELFNVYGLGEMFIVNIDNKLFNATVRINNSSLAEEHLNLNGISKRRVCTLTAGILAGIFSYIFRKNVECVEVNCKAQGKDYCLFNIE